MATDPPSDDTAQPDAEETYPDDLAGDPVDTDVATPKAPAAEALRAHRGADHD